MIVQYEDDGNISGKIQGGYNLSRLNLGNINWIEVERQDLEGKKVDPETEKLVDKDVTK